MRKLVIVVAVGCIAAADAAPEFAPGRIEVDSHQSVPAVPIVPSDVDADTATAGGAASDAGGDAPDAGDAAPSAGNEWVIAPLPARNPLLGWMVAMPVMRVYRPESSDPDNKTWSSGIAGLYAENESWGYGAFHDMSLGGDRWRVLAAGFRADVTYDYYGIGGDRDSPSVPISQPSRFFMVQALREVAPNFYFGIETTMLRSEISLKIPEDQLPPGFELPRLPLRINTLAPALEYDTRDDQFYPTQGVLAKAQASVGREALGSDLDYERYSIELNHYHSLSSAAILASRVAIDYAAGDAPFFVYPAFGSRADLRGYQTGTYRDRFLFAMQTEYRRRLSDRFGAVAFAGIGTVTSDFGEWGDSLPSVGVGLRYLLAAANNINLRFDVARGRDDTMWYVGLREAF